MISVFYFNISDMANGEMETYMNRLPEFMQADIIRYKYISDRKARLIARMMLYQCLTEENVGGLIYEWKKDNNNKPFISKWKPFSISHSGDMVMFSYANKAVGIDIEEECEIAYPEMIEYFHPAEQEFIMRSGKVRESFYEIWVKKEALLKTIGTGITNELKHFNCIDESVNYEGGHWHFHSLSIHPGYTSYLCSPEKNEKILIKKFLL